MHASACKHDKHKTSFIVVAGAAIAVEAGDVTLFTTDLRCLSSIVRLGRAARQIILFNITISVVTKVNANLIILNHLQFVAGIHKRVQ